MMEKTPMSMVTDVFKKIDFGEDMHAMSGCFISGIDADKSRQTMSISVKPGFALPRAVILRVQSAIKDALRLKEVSIIPRYNDAGIDGYLDTVKEKIYMDFPAAMGKITHDPWIKTDKNTLEVTVTTENDAYMEDVLREIESIISNETGEKITVSYKLQDAEKSADDYSSERRRRLENIAAEIQNGADKEKEKEKRKVKTGKKSTSGERKRNSASAAKIKREDVIFGTPKTMENIDISSAMFEYGVFSIKGKVFAVNHREIPSKNLSVVSFDMTDNTGSMRVVKVMKSASAAPVTDAIKPGAYLIVQGTSAYSNFERDTIMTPTAIAKAEQKVRMDTAQEKRVELHLHTNMSAMDGVSDFKGFIERAALWGHDAIALTDHGVAQAFPTAMHEAAKHKGIKVLYGIEGYLGSDDDEASAVFGSGDTKLSDTFIAFDIETTGLSPLNEEITEIAAVRITNMEMGETFHTYVNPQKPIPLEITRLTGISDKTVENAPTIDTVLPQFLDFCGDDPLVAHNASFDMSFIKSACRRFDIDKSFVSIDTLEISRILMPELSKHKLDSVAKGLGLGNFDHHRASEDTAVLARIFIEFLRKMQDEYGITYIGEMNMRLAQLRQKNRRGRDNSKTNHIILIAENYVGLKNLYKLISMSNLHYFRKYPVMPRKLIQKYRDGILVGSACEAGEFFEAIVSGKSDEEIEKIADFYDYFEIQPIGNNKFMIRNGMASDEEQLRDFNRRVVDIADKKGKPVVATGDVHFLDPEDEIYRRILMAGMGFSDADEQAPLYFRTTDEMLEEFSYLGEKRAYEVVVTNTRKIAAMCDEIQPVPKESYPPEIEGSAELLQKLVYSKAKELYGENLPPQIKDRLEAEMTSIIKHKFDVMYIIAQKLVSKSLEDGYLVGSRGSVGSSLVAFLSGITEVNALAPHYRCPQCLYCEFDESDKYSCGADMPDKSCPVCGGKLEKDGFKIPFATFLGFDGDKAPDIDLNFSGEYQSNAHKYTIEIFGKQQVFRAGTIGTIAEKTAFGFVKKYLEEKGLEVSRAEENRLTMGCTGVKRTTGQHPGGLIIVPKEKEIYDFCPVQHPADDINTDIITTHFDYHSIDQNLLKLDLLGHDDPTMIKMLEDLTGVRAQDIPLDDPETMSIFTSSSALGIDGDDILGTTGAAAIPEFGTKFVREMLIDTKPTTFDELIRISGLSHGTDVWLGNAQPLVQNGTATLKEIICARDDIMNYLISMGLAPKLSFTIMESVRKGKGLKPEWKDEMIKYGVPEWYIESCEKIKYMFPRAHAAAYVMMAFRIAWFKVHRPLAFYCAYFTIRANAFDAETAIKGDGAIIAKLKELESKEKLTAIEQDSIVTLEVCHEMYRRGFKFEPVDIYKSDATRFIIKDDSLRPPLTALPGLGEAAANAIVKERKKSKFLSIDDMQLRCAKVNKAVIDILEKNGALEALPSINQVSFF